MKSFHEVHYEWGCDKKGAYETITMEKDVKNLVEGYDKYTESDFKV